jgi:hypothetical protein
VKSVCSTHVARPQRAAETGREEGGTREGVETTFDGKTLVVRIPMRFQRRGGRKRIVALDGNDIVPTSKLQPDSTLEGTLANLAMAPHAR